MYAKVETITPERAKELLTRNLTNRKISKTVVRRYADDIKRGSWEENGETICIGKNGELKDGQHRLSAIIEANIPVTVVVVYGIEDYVHEYDRNYKRQRPHILQMHGYPKSISNAATVGAVNFLLTESGRKGASDSEFITVVDNLGHICNTAFKCVSSGINHPISMKAGCTAAAIIALYYGIDESVVCEFFTAVNTGFVESKTQYSAVVVRNYLITVHGGFGGVRTKEDCIISLKGIIDYSEKTPRRNRYDTKEIPKMMTAMVSTVKEWVAI